MQFLNDKLIRPRKTQSTENEYGYAGETQDDELNASTERQVNEDDEATIQQDSIKPAVPNREGSSTP
ncbi:unnamed protein product [Acanthoscelides obtectus]|uniref:Uncharacterized protein n=1 Tax=Acanthoscelides obtectus TaxID=200917 RepID=A0A9P0KUT7_ACAOB|nr:unnamed protein product [Acanthoscelides obtectus]CAK1672041.1 hypothetical protein AOBTE_LOCUS28618 [Acanthoscelides obtectus]